MIDATDNCYLHRLELLIEANDAQQAFEVALTTLPKLCGATEARFAGVEQDSITVDDRGFHHARVWVDVPEELTVLIDDELAMRLLLQVPCLAAHIRVLRAELLEIRSPDGATAYRAS
jgi:hypothetical protein